MQRRAFDFSDNTHYLEEESLIEDFKVPKELRRNDICLSDVLGDGQFGVVHKAIFKNSKTGQVLFPLRRDFLV